jgi:hypothetical protein
LMTREMAMAETVLVKENVWVIWPAAVMDWCWTTRR